MKHLKQYSGFILLCAAAFFPVACSDEQGGDDGASNLRTFSFIIKVPSADSTVDSTRAVGDPGTAVDENDVWDRLTVIVAFDGEVTNTNGTTNTQKVFYKTISRSDFNSLRDYTGYDGYKVFEMSVPLGTAYIYGITYTKEANDFGADIAKLTSKGEVEALTISNDYASSMSADRWSHFMSVATGFYTGIKESSSDNTYPYVNPLSSGITSVQITAEDESSLGKPIALLYLERLAAKIDVQWDAADAYAAGTSYTDVKVTDFKFTGGVTDATDAGSGRLFPELYTGSDALNGVRSMANTTEISKRNGREYLYMFPDGTSSAQGTLSFNVTTKVSGSTDATGKTYKYTMPVLSRATWYKCHFTVKGNSGQSSTEEADFTGESQTTGGGS